MLPVSPSGCFLMKPSRLSGCRFVSPDIIFFMPAIASAPAGSSTERVSLKPSLIAAQI